MSHLSCLPLLHPPPPPLCAVPQILPLKVGSTETSPNQQLLAWTEDTVGGEKYTLHVKDLSTGREVMPPLPMTSGNVMWANDNATLFYTVKDHLDRPYKVLRHRWVGVCGVGGCVGGWVVFVDVEGWRWAAGLRVHRAAPQVCMWMYVCVRGAGVCVCSAGFGLLELGLRVQKAAP